ncbi:glycosyltransferase family 2 protein [Plebeiibacterium marinum]|uniref:Glycosyltransferase n=1 Tax=Plebeiibacterium marinum TaxID=2992111 RepID=A0AAE3ME26_9BACT|nr:glycosyltransferase family 2 protein [Plebeiobacterium marinum]MCW3805814.1 glycosyltransferase [Plebeiobacterium marinum]
MLVSVIITTYQRPVFLERAIRSILNQTYPEIELIVVDDNDQDSEARQLTESLIKKYPDIIYVKHPENKGANAARNSGIRIAKGEYIAFLDDDDEFLGTKIAKQVEVAKKHKSKKGVLIFTSYNVIGNPSLQKSRWANKFKSKLFFPEDNFIYTGNYIGSNSFILVDKQSLEQVNCYDENLQSSQDWDLYIRLNNYGVKFVGINEDLVNYYSDHSEFRITANKDKRLSGFFAISRKYKNEIEDLDKDLKFRHYNYLYRRVISIDLRSGAKRFPKLLKSASSLSHWASVLMSLIYPFAFSFKRIIFSGKNK